MTRRYLANVCGPLSKFTSLALTYLVYRTFPKVSLGPVASHTLHITNEETEWQWDSLYCVIIDLGGSKKGQLNILASRGEIIVF